MTLFLKFKRLLFSLAFVIGTLAASPTAQAQLAYTDGDVLLCFRATLGEGGSTGYLVNLGPVTQFVNAAGQINVDLGGSIVTDLETIFGVDWKTRGDVLWSVSGVQKVAGNGFPNNTMFASKLEFEPGTQSIPWTKPSSFGAGTPVLKVQSVGLRYSTGTTSDGGIQDVSPNNLKALIQTNSSANSYRSHQPGGLNTTGNSAYSYFIGAEGIENSFANGTQFSVLDFYSLAPGSGNADLVGGFRMNDDGTLTFEKNISNFQGPATVKFTLPEYPVSEEAGTIQLEITRAGNLTTAFSINFSTSDGTALTGTDYTGQTNVPVSFAAQETSKTVNVTILDRAGFQGNRAFNATIGVTSGNAQAIVPSTATVNIAESDPEPATLAFSTPTYTVAEDGGTLTVTINRTGGTSGTASVNLSTIDGTAVAGTDFTGQTNTPVNFAALQTTQTVNVAITDRADFQGSRNFTVALSGASAGATIGTPNPATVTITETDPNPAGVFAFGQAAYNFASKNALGQPNTVSLTITRSNGTTGAASVPVSVAAGGNLDAGDFTFSNTSVDFLDGEAVKELNIPLTASVGPLPGFFNLQLGAPTNGSLGSPAMTTVNIVAPDLVPPKIKLTSPKPGKSSATFDVVGEVVEPDTVARVEVRLNDGAPMNATLGAPAGGVTPFNLTGLAAENGSNTLLVQAFDNKGTASKVTKVVFIFTNLNLGLAGVYNGLAVPTAVAPPAGDLHNASGLVSLTVGKTGTFTGKVLIGGTVLPFSGVLQNNGAARFKPALGNTLTLVKRGKVPLTFGNLALTVAADGPTGFKATGAIGAIATIDAPRAFFDGKITLVDQAYLTPNKGKFTAVLPSKAQPVLTNDLFPQGDGVGGITILKTGKLTYIGSLADGTVVVASGPLSKNLKASLYAPLYAKKGSIAGVVTLDNLQVDSDLEGADFLWLRPAQPKAKQYVAGWPGGVKVDLMAAKYVVPDKTLNQSVFPGLGPDDLVNGNATVQFADGKLTGVVPPKNINITGKNKVTNAPATDKTFKVTLVAPTGAMLGFFTHTDLTKPKFKAIVYQKGLDAGAYGYFLSLQPKNGPPGEGGGVTILAK
jgi:hypothetical protein